jgi:uncharacterized protein (DUF342 family)
MGTNTLLEVGINPTTVDEFHTLERDISIYRADREKLMPILTNFKKKIANGENIQPEKFEFIKIATRNCIELDEKLRISTQRYEQLKLDMNNTEGGSIRIENIAYPGVKIVISNVVYYVRSEIHYTKFIRDRADIKLVGL